MKCFCGHDFSDLKVNNLDYFLCENCGYLRKKEIPSSKEEKSRYDNHICDDGYKEYMELVYQKIKPYLVGNCLDYGCGKIHALADILNKNNIPCSYYDLYYFNELPNNKFDTIILIEVFEHILDIYSLMNKLKEMLNENGRIIIMTKKKVYPLEKWWYLRDITHISFVDSKTMDILGNLSNLKVKEEDGYFIFFKN